MTTKLYTPFTHLFIKSKQVFTNHLQTICTTILKISDDSIHKRSPIYYSVNFLDRLIRMSANDDNKNLNKFLDRQQDTIKPASSTPVGETLMIPEICRLIAEYQEELEEYKQKYLELLYQVKRGSIRS